MTADVCRPVCCLFVVCVCLFVCLFVRSFLGSFVRLYVCVWCIMLKACFCGLPGRSRTYFWK